MNASYASYTSCAVHGVCFVCGVSISRPRNPLLFAMLERMDLVEKIGSGIKRMRGDMKEEGHPFPKVEIGNTWFSITFLRPESEMFAGEVTGEVTGEVKMLLRALIKPLGRVELQKKTEP